MPYKQKGSGSAKSKVSLHEKLASRAFANENGHKLMEVHGKLPGRMQQWVGKRTLEAFKRQEAERLSQETYSLLDAVINAAADRRTLRMVTRGSEGEQYNLRATSFGSSQASISLRAPEANRDTLQINRRERSERHRGGHSYTYDVIRPIGERSHSSGALDSLKIDDRLQVLKTLHDVLSPVVLQLDASKNDTQSGVINLNRYRVDRSNPQPREPSSSTSYPEQTPLTPPISLPVQYHEQVDAPIRSDSEQATVTVLFKMRSTQSGRPSGNDPGQIA
jgi:hypothetical protein